MRTGLGVGGLLLIWALSSPAVAQTISYSPNVTLKVGQTTVIHGIRGGSGCSDPAPDWATASATLPASTLGTFSDGGVGTRGSRSCGAVVPARAVRFKATKKGSEALNIQGDAITVTVQ